MIIFQSLGKEYIKVYINGNEQTDIDVNSISWTENLNASATAIFNLGRAFDSSSKPSTGDTVEIKYNNFLMYKGYIIEINPTENPESIRVSCQDEYWNLNKIKTYFIVGRKPKGAREYYTLTIYDGLDILGWNPDVGKFVPQSIDCYGLGKADAISNLIQQCGNFGWFIKPDGSKNLWRAGKGSIVNIESQKIGTNLGLYQVIGHNIRKSTEGLINKFRVQLGNWTIRRIYDVDGSGRKTYERTLMSTTKGWAEPLWDENNQILAINSSIGYGWDYHKPEDDEKYVDVFKKFRLPHVPFAVDSSWSDRHPPIVEIYAEESLIAPYLPSGWAKSYIESMETGYTIDYDENTITFSDPIVFFEKNSIGENISARPGAVFLRLWKEKKFTYNPSQATDPYNSPPQDPSYPLMFYTSKMGDYPDTIVGSLNLSNLSIQTGGLYKRGNTIVYIPSWDDREYAYDYADWQLSKNCDIKTLGTIDLTIDTMLFYGINLSNRIKIDGIIDTPINIQQITYNVSNFTATLSLQSGRYYRRTISIPYHGE